MSEHTRQYWELHAEKHEDSFWASFGYNWKIDLEINAICEHIAHGNKVIDIRCADVYSAS